MQFFYQFNNSLKPVLTNKPLVSISLENITESHDNSYLKNAILSIEKHSQSEQQFNEDSIFSFNYDKVLFGLGLLTSTLNAYSYYCSLNRKMTMLQKKDVPLAKLVISEVGKSSNVKSFGDNVIANTKKLLVGDISKIVIEQFKKILVGDIPKIVIEQFKKFLVGEIPKILIKPSALAVGGESENLKLVVHQSSGSKFLPETNHKQIKESPLRESSVITESCEVENWDSVSYLDDDSEVSLSDLLPNIEEGGFALEKDGVFVNVADDKSSILGDSTSGDSTSGDSFFAEIAECSIEEKEVAVIGGVVYEVVNPA